MANLLKVIIFMVFMGISLSHQSLFGQSIDPAMLDILKARAGGGASNKAVTSPLDQIREDEYIRNQQPLLEERKKKVMEISPLEEDYQARLASKITLYGHSVFANMPSNNNIMTGAMSDNYQLGIGDQLIVTLQGAKSETYILKVDLDGRVLIPDLKPITVTGMRYGDFKAVLKKQVSESIIGTEVYISLSEVRRISVFVMGEVNSPGVINTSSLATPLELLMKAGGVKKTGSLRSITIYRNGNKSIFDLYDLLNGAISGFDTLNDGDRIIVPTIGATIALDGDLVRPGIYELPANVTSISFKQAMALAGGTLRPSGYEMSQIKLNEKGQQRFDKVDDSGTIYNGEAIIARLIENSQTGRVELLGHVKAPGFRSLSSTPDIRSLLGGIHNLQSDPYLLFSVIERIEPKTQARFLKAFSAKNILSGGKDIALKNEDRVIFLGRNDIDFLISNQVRNVIVAGQYSVMPTLSNGENNTAYCKPLNDLARIINDTQSNRFATATRAVFVRKEVEEVVSGKSGLQSHPLSGNGLEKLDIQKRIKEAQDAVKVENKKKKKNFSCPEIYSQVNNLLPFILEYIVSVDGAVRLPGVYPITQGASLESLIAVSGGTSHDANLAHIEIASLDTAKDSDIMHMKWNYVDGNHSNLSAIGISPGGGIRVGSKFSNFESGAVLVSGEFSQPGVYTIRKGEKLSDLMKRAGGITEQAYTYGAIFTRDKVKEIQRAELQKTARHLQSAMVSASVKKNIDSSSMMAAQQLTRQMANAKLIGRVVIEADPVKLSLNPALDTVLEAGDAIYMPKRPNFIIAMGDVLNPGALQFVPGKGVAQYISEVGNYTQSADRDRVYIVYPNGVARPITLSSWGWDRKISIPPGTAIVVPTNLSPYDTLTLVKEIGTIFQNFAVSAASIAVISRR